MFPLMCVAVHACSSTYDANNIRSEVKGRELQSLHVQDLWIRPVLAQAHSSFLSKTTININNNLVIVVAVPCVMLLHTNNIHINPVVALKISDSGSTICGAII